MSENWKIQVSPKLADGTLINLRAETPEEAEKVLAWATANASLVTDTVKAFVGTAVVTQSFPGAQVVEQNGPSWSQNGSQQQAAPAAPPGGEHRCIHGPREYKDFTSKAGKHIKMWSCTAPRGQQCDPEWVK